MNCTCDYTNVVFKKKLHLDDFNCFFGGSDELKCFFLLRWFLWKHDCNAALLQ